MQRVYICSANYYLLLFGFSGRRPSFLSGLVGLLPCL